MTKYRKLPVVIEAHRIGDDVWPEAIWEGVEAGIISLFLSHVTIMTLEGSMVGYDGDYIIRGIDGEFYPCKSDIFNQTYELVDGDHDVQFNDIINE